MIIKYLISDTTINGHKKTIRFGDEITLIVESVKLSTYSKSIHNTANIKIKDEKIEQVKFFYYLGSLAEDNK